MATISSAAALSHFTSFGEAYLAKAYEPLTRAYTGATTADTVSRPAYVVDDLARLAASRPTLSMFATGRLPKIGKKVEYPTFTVTGEATAQAAEGDDLPEILVQVEAGLADVRTVGATAEMSMQAASAEYVDRVKAVQAAVYGVRSNKIAVSALAAATGANTATLAFADKGKASAWVNLAALAAEAIADNAQAAFEPYAWILSRQEAAALRAVVDASGVPVFAPQGAALPKVNGVRPIGYVNGIPVVVDKFAAAGTSHIVAREAMTARESSPFDLTKITAANLSRRVSLYGYLSIEPTDVGGIVRVSHPAA